MGVIRSLRRFRRRAKLLIYVVAFFFLLQLFIGYGSDPNSVEESHKMSKELKILENRQAANALLLGENPRIFKKEEFIVNAKDPKLREQFLKHVGGDNGIGVLEEKNLNDQNLGVIRANAVLPAPNEGYADDNFEYHPVCEVTLKDSQSAISRAKTAQCKQEISDVACKMQANDLFPESMPRTCPHEKKFVAPAPMPTSFDNSLIPVRICFVLVVHGRSFRQFKRLLRVIYHRNHYYYIHVDARSDYLMREIVKATRPYANVKVAQWRMATIWGGASLLQMLLRAMKDVLSLWKDWDFFINLSGLDFPIEVDEKLTKFLATYRDKNFMKSHGRDDEKFIKKQGLDRVFVECDQHMWRLGKRELPKGLSVNGGSDWVALNRNFCEFAIYSKDKLVTDLKYWYRYTLLPAESFFHTLVQNSEICESFVDNNLRVTNWNRARGCKCQYKHIVDWCGCSPNDFFPADLTRLQTSRPVFFARKFEEIINQEVVNHLDFKLYGDYPTHTPGLTSYWENCYDYVDGPKSVSDALLTHYASFARLGLADLNKQLSYQDEEEECSLKSNKIYQVEVFKKNEQISGYIVTFGASWGEEVNPEPDVHLQTLVARQSLFRILDESSQLASRIETASVGTNWDVKELVLRDWGGIVGPQSDPRLVARWRRGAEDFVVTVVVIDPLNVVADYADFRTPAKSAGITETPLSLRKPIRPGKWTIRFYIQRQFNKVCAEVDFFVTPLQFKDSVEGDAQLSTDNRGVVDDALLNAANRNLYSIRTTLSLTKDLEAFRILVANSLQVAGQRLKSWIDSVLNEAWKVKDVCYVSKDSDNWKMSQPSRCKRARQITPNLCANMNWSSFSPDPKSDLGPVKANGRIR